MIDSTPVDWASLTLNASNAKNTQVEIRSALGPTTGGAGSYQYTLWYTVISMPI
jgi:hypothetical protein